ncbi:MAG: hypothetical protein FRX49_13768 [Trebouxia sp. A1-2]|nr:MAG: hypothetical protein FRX49_13768 [Trebouxia sp. A1-2]
MAQQTGSASASAGWIAAADSESLRLAFGKASRPRTPFLTIELPQLSCTLFKMAIGGIVHPPPDDGGTERTWSEPEQRPRKRAPKRSVHGKQSPQGASKTFWRQDDQP